MRPGLPLWVLVFLLARSSVSAAQTRTVQGLVLGVSAEASHSRADRIATANGAGVTGMLGFGVSRHAAVLLGVGVAGSAHGLIAHAEVGARAYLPVANRVVVFGELAFASHGRELADETLDSGTGVSMGLGGEYFVRPHRAITFAAHRWSGRLDHAGGGTLLRYSVGLNLRAPRGP
jgi:hypothetical protein